MVSKKDMHTYEEKHRILLQAKDFICLRPHPNLLGCISNYNITFPTRHTFSDGFTLMPSGCATLSIENDGKNLCTYLDGPTTKPYVTGSLSGQLEMIITIEFKPAGLYAITGVNQNELTDITIPFDAINPGLSRLISDTVEDAGNVTGLVSGLDMLFTTNISAAYHPQLGQIFHNILTSAGNTTLKRLSDDIFYSERQINRIFIQHVGMSAKSFARLVRINNSFRLLKKPGNSLTLVSDTTGFHDLSHFTRDFKLVCGITPQEYRNNMSAFYNNTTKF